MCIYDVEHLCARTHSDLSTLCINRVRMKKEFTPRIYILVSDICLVITVMAWVCTKFVVTQCCH